MFEHADHAVPRLEHGYCTDDVARLLIAIVREPARRAGAQRARQRVLSIPRRLARRHRAHAQPAQRRRTLARPARRRGLLGSQRVGVRDRRAPRSRRVDAQRRDRRTSTTPSGNARRTDGRWRSPRSAPPSCSLSHPATRRALELLADAVVTIGPVSADAHVAVARGAAVVRQRRAAGGADRGRVACSTGRDVLADGLLLLALAARPSDRRRTPVAGTGRRRRTRAILAPAFDQQPIEVAALADACARAESVTGDATWRDGVELAIGWFAGDNDVRRRDVGSRSPAAASTASPANGPNLNQGAESTLALITTMQHRRVRRPTPRPLPVANRSAGRAGLRAGSWRRRAPTSA